MAHRSSWAGALLGLAAGSLLVALLPSSLLFVAHTPGATADVATGERWACPMIDFIGNRPGACPVCGMEMTRIVAGELSAEQTRRMDLETTRVVAGPARLAIRAQGLADYDNRFTHVVVPRIAGRIVARHEATWGCCQQIAVDAPIIDVYSPEVIAAQGELEAARRLGDPALIANLRARFERWNLVEVADAVLRGEPIREVVTLRSPHAGRVYLRDYEMVNETLAVGRELMPDMPLLRLVDADRLVLVLQVPEEQARWVREGQPVHLVQATGQPLDGVQAVVSRLALETDPRLRTREVRVFLSGVEGRLGPGALVEARIESVLGPDLEPADPEDSETWGAFTLIPKEAVLSTGVRHVAWKVANKTRQQTRFELVALALGPRIESPTGQDLYVVRAGLEPGTEVVTQGAFLVDSQAQLAGTASLLNP